VWVFTHQAVIMAFRFLLESLTEQELLRIDGSTPLGNCSLTVYRPAPGGELDLVVYGDVDHLEESEAEPTHEEPHAPGRGATAGDRS
jgi:broad specificity phosphatase PhoE